MRYPLPAILALAVAAILANHLSVLAIAEWGRAAGARSPRGSRLPPRTPCQSTLLCLVRQLDGHGLVAALTTFFAPSSAPAAPTPAPQGIAIDGKAQRGRLRFRVEGRFTP